MVRASQDVIGVVRGMQLVAEALVREQTQSYKHVWMNSSVRDVVEDQLKQSSEYIDKVRKNPGEEIKNVEYVIKETRERGYVLFKNFQLLASVWCPTSINMNQRSSKQSSDFNRQTSDSSNYAPPGDSQYTTTEASSEMSPTQSDASHLDISNITLKELEDILKKRYKDREINLRTSSTESKRVPQSQTHEGNSNRPMDTIADRASAIHERKYAPLVQPHIVPQPEAVAADAAYLENVLGMVAGPRNDSIGSSGGTTMANNSMSSSKTDLPDLTKVAKQRSVPSSRIGRMASFGSLFAGLGIGTINELTKGALGLGGAKNMQEALFSPANTERIVDTLCKVRGAALKIGQILSIQDSKVVSPQLAKAFERVRQAADYMPDWQVERVMTTQLEPGWRSMLDSFDQTPFAAASIGQVHRATLNNGMEVAVKIQYPGVAKSIESDIDNLVGMLKVWNVFPHGFFIDNMVKVAKRELNWEVDYTREAEFTEKFKEMIAAYPEYYVPTVIKELTTSSVLTTEFVPGVPLDKCFDLSYEHRKHIALNVMKLCLRELFELQCMQTDPNWSNFLYDAPTKRIMLIDFGSTRFYQKKFIKKYREVIINAVRNNREGVLEISREMGFLTGYESKQMEEAHIDAVMILGEMFRYKGEFDFGKQNTTERISHLVPTMVAHRLCPPPEEIYSIHRKLSGIFLLCSRMRVKLDCRDFFEEIVIRKFRE